MTTTRLIWKLRKFAIRWTLQSKCVCVCVGGGGGGGALNSVNKALFGGLPLAYQYFIRRSHIKPDFSRVVGVYQCANRSCQVIHVFVPSEHECICTLFCIDWCWINFVRVRVRVHRSRHMSGTLLFYHEGINSTNPKPLLPWRPILTSQKSNQVT